jgi:transcriptional regulator with XRE-family HTH domain
MLITKSEAARRLGVTKQALQQWENRDPRPGYFVDTDNKVMVDTSSEDWIQRIKQSETKGIKQNLINEKVSQAKKFKADLKKSVFDNVDYVEEIEESPRQKRSGVPDIPENVRNPELEELQRRAAIAAMEDIIFAAGIKREKEMQEKLKTLEIKKDLANVDLMIHFFSFIENIIQRWYRRPHEIGPKLKAFYLGGQDREAEQLMLRELESIVKDTQKDLLKALEEEGIKFKGMIKK